MLRKTSLVILIAGLALSCEKKAINEKFLNSINPPSEPSESPVCIITFDDGYNDVFSSVNPLMEKYGFKGDCFIICGLVGYGEIVNNPKLSSENHMTWEELRILDNLGWGIYNHTCSHLPPSDSDDIVCCYDTLIAHGFEGDVFAYPFGQYNDTMVAWIKQNHVAARTTDWGLSDHFLAHQEGAYRLKALQVSGSINPARIEGMIDSCICLNKVLIVIYHNFCYYPGCAITHKIYIGDFAEVLTYLDSKRKDITVMTFKGYLNR
jgi:hypothetical protein